MPKNTTGPLHFSTMAPNLIDFTRRLPMIVCPGCDTWITVSGKTLPVHRSDNRPDAPRDHNAPRRPRCTESGREVLRDATEAEVGARLFRAKNDGGNRHRTRTAHPAFPAVLPPVHRIAAAR